MKHIFHLKKCLPVSIFCIHFESYCANQGLLHTKRLRLNDRKYNSVFKLRTGQKQPPNVFCKKGVLRNFAKFTGKNLCQNLFFNKNCNFTKKETLPRVFSCEFYKISKNTFFTEHLRTTASERETLNGYKRNTVLKSLKFCVFISTKKIL